MDAPFLYNGGENVRFSLKQVAALVDNLRQLNALDALIEASEGNDELAVEVPPAVINFIKMQMFKAGLHKQSEVSRSYISSGIDIFKSSDNQVQCAHMPVRPG